MEDLPADLMNDILSRLPVKTIIHCKRVCKKWRDLVLDSLFVNLHLSRSPTALILHHKRHIISKDPGILKLVEIENTVDHHHLHHDPTMSVDLNLTPILQNPLIEQRGSVNGLICLCQHSPKLDNTYICNPVTREIMILPSQRCYSEFAIPFYGFGVSSVTGEYKVVRIFRSNENKLSVLEAEVYTLGTGQWRSLGRVPYRLNQYYGPFLNNHCHWIICDEEDVPEKICTFDLDKETFQLFPSPPYEAIQKNRFLNQSLAVLKGCLCKVDICYSELTIWVMKEYGIKKSWHKEVVIEHGVSGDVIWLLRQRIYLIEGLKDGSILMVSQLYYKYKLWAYCPQSNTIEDTGISDRCFSGLTYRPSFLKLQNFDSERVHMF